MQSNKWTTDADGFRDAVANDEYAELELPNGDVLITDWEGDGTFNPYVEPDNGNTFESPQDTAARLGDEIAELLGVDVDVVEYDQNNDVFVPHMERP